MKNYTLILLAYLCAFFSASAQSNFKSGYIVALNGDTTRGFIDYKEWNENPEKVAFKTTGEAAAQQYTPLNLNAFGVDGLDHFKQYSGRLSNNSVELGSLSRGLDTSYITGTVFLRELASGKNVKLFSHVDKFKQRFFIAEENATPVELKYYVYLDDQNASQINKSNFFTRQLIALALKYQADNKALNNDIVKAEFREGTLKNIVKQLNGNIDNNTNEPAKRGGHRFYFGAAGNLVNATFDEVGKQPLKLAGATVNAGVDFYFNKNVGRWLFRAEVGVSQNTVSIPRSEETHELGFNQLSVSFSPQVIYNLYNKENLKIYLAGGFHISSNSFKDKTYVDSKRNFRYEDVIPAYTAKAGMLLNKRFEIYAGYLTQVQATTYPIIYDLGGRIITTYKEQVLKLTTYQFGINYIIGSK